LIRKLIERRGTLARPLTSKLLTTTTIAIAIANDRATGPARGRAERRKLYRFLSQLVAVLITGNCRHFTQKAFHFRRSPLSMSDSAVSNAQRAIDVTYSVPYANRIKNIDYPIYSGNITLYKKMTSSNFRIKISSRVRSERLFKIR